MDEQQMAAAFAEWMRRYQADPDAFDRDWLEAGGDAEDYGTRSARYFQKLLDELAAARA